ncbi:hypothetical protein C8R44DRAFT_585533, partial [Mycena epipterygia]
YPVITLPNEMTSRIFLYCIPTQSAEHHSIHTAPLLLIQICRHWRDIALSTSELW